MWTILITIYAFVLLTLTTTATAVAPFVADHNCANRILTTWQHPLVAATPCLAIRRHQAGLL